MGTITLSLIVSTALRPMKVKWKKNKSFHPEIVLEKLVEKEQKSQGGYDISLEYSFALSTLETMIDFPDNMEGIDKHDLILSAISKARELKKDIFIEELWQIISQKNAKKENIFHILTSLSLTNYPTKSIDVEDCIIELLDNDYPDKYIPSRKAVLENKKINFNDATIGYTKIIIIVHAKSVNSAVSKALRALDLQRAIWCLSKNTPFTQLFGNEWEPINKIRLGETHSAHFENGENAIDTFWFEPNFVIARSINVQEEPENFGKNNEWLWQQLKKSKYSEKLKVALLRYVRALDERDQNNAIIKLWAAIESLTSPSGVNGDLITKRCSFIFPDFKFHKQVLEHLREYRNGYVHAGDQREEAKNICYQLQFYFRELIKFYLSKTDLFTSIEKANEFLDLPPDKADLIRKKELIESALSYVSKPK